MREQFACGGFGPSVRGVSFEYGHHATLFGHGHAHHWHGHGHRHHRHGNKHHGHRHGPHGNPLNYHGPPGYGPFHRLRVHGHHGPLSYGPHGYEYFCHKPHGFGFPQGNKTCQPNHFWNSMSYPNGLPFGGPHECRRGHREKGNQGSNRGHCNNFQKPTTRPHSV